MGAVIIVTNMSVSLFMFTRRRARPGIQGVTSSGPPSPGLEHDPELVLLAAEPWQPRPGHCASRSSSPRAAATSL
jgi:hypothetical protein